MAGLDQHLNRREQGRHEYLEQGREEKKNPAAAAAPCRSMQKRKNEAEELRHQQDRHGDGEQSERALRIEARKGRKQRELAGEIFGLDVARLEDEHDTDESCSSHKGEAR